MQQQNNKAGIYIRLLNKAWIHDIQTNPTKFLKRVPPSPRGPPAHADIISFTTPKATIVKVISTC